MTTPFEELLRKTEGELTSRRAAELDAELARSPELQAEQRRVEQLVDAASRPAPGLEGIDLREGLWTREVPSRRARRWPVVASLGALAAAAALLVAAPWREEFTGKGGGGSTSGFEAFVLRGEQAAPLGPQMARGDALGFAYRNLPDSPWKALMIYGVDERGEVFWFYPSWATGEPPPSSVPIVTASGRVELPQAVRHELRPGRLVLHALFTREALSVTDVEAGRLPADAHELTQVVEVTE